MSEIGDLYKELKKERQDRRQKRMNRCLTDSKLFAAFCVAEGYELKIKNEGHHWIIKTKNHVIEWYPSSAKYILDRDYKNIKHIWKVDQLVKKITELEK